MPTDVTCPETRTGPQDKWCFLSRINTKENLVCTDDCSTMTSAGKVHTFKWYETWLWFHKHGIFSKLEKNESIRLGMLGQSCVNLRGGCVEWLLPCGTVTNTQMWEKVQVTRRAAQTVFRGCSRACGTHMITRHTEPQFSAISFFMGTVCANRTLCHTGAIWKYTKRK